MDQPSLIVSVHDIMGSTLDRAQQQLKELASLGLHRTSLLVVPYYHGQEQLEDHTALCDWLGRCQTEGHEIVLHGWLHQNSKPSTASLSPPISRWFYEQWYTSGEAEFLALGYDEAHLRIRKGLDLLRQLKLNIHGFIAPAWLMNPEVERAAGDHKLLYTNTISELVHLPDKRRHPSRACVWSTRARWRRMSSLAWNALLFHRLKSADPLRISLHPCDLEYPAIWRQIKDLIQSALKTRLATTYADWIQTHAKMNSNPASKRDHE